MREGFSAARLCLLREERLLFSDLSLECRRGEALHVQGANGIGKSSLLLALSGLLPLASGDISWLGVRASSDWLAYQRQVFYLGHRIALSPLLTPLEHLTLDPRVTGERSYLEAVLRRLSLFSKRHVQCRYLSAGQRQRVALARLLLSRASLYFIDEPLTALDKEGVEQFESICHEKLNQASALVLTSHHELHFANPCKRLVLELGT